MREMMDGPLSSFLSSLLFSAKKGDLGKQEGLPSFLYANSYYFV
jgi:hypothetical protein